MDTFVIQGGAKLKGDIQVKGAKNCALAILPATTLIKGKVILHNMPKIGDVLIMLGILESMGAKVKWTAENTVEVDNSQINPEKMDYSLVGKIRASLMLIGPLAARFGRITISTPGGCKIGTRPIDAHLQGLEALGFSVTIDENKFTVVAGNKFPDEIVMREFSPTGVQNILLAAIGLQRPVTIKIAVPQYSVLDLCWFLQDCGAVIEGIGTHTLKIRGSDSDLRATEYTIMPDPIEAGTFMALAAAANAQIQIKEVPLDFLVLELEKFREVGVNFTIKNIRLSVNKHYEVGDIAVSKSTGLKPLAKLHNMPAPGFMPDLLQPFAVMLTQAKGVSLIYDWMYDGRIKYVKDLKRMGADMEVLDAHRVMVAGPTPLFGKTTTSYDLRAGATMIIAALIAEGESVIKDIHQVDRGYEKIDERLQALGADIKRQ